VTERFVEPGHLYVVATPLGNLADLSERARRVLSAVDVVCAEDTRHTLQLLGALDLRARALWSLHEHTERQRATEVVQALQRGQALALVSDAGTPTVSDPGYLTVLAVAEAGLPVVPVPGPCAAIAALSASGLPPLPFTILGFGPKRGSKLQSWLRERLLPGATYALYVPARDLNAFLGELAAVCPHAPTVVARELTKLHETHYRGAAGALQIPEDALRGEAVVLVHQPELAPEAALATELAAAAQLLIERGLSRRDATIAVAALRDIPRSAVESALGPKPLP
jgi:16S rRNA (cytidine1402-2'-O)-methyltransferase